MQTITRFELRFLRTGEWIRSDDVDAASLVQAWLAVPQLGCCSFQGGLFIDIDGEPWSDDSTVDEFQMTLFWFHAIAELDRGASSFGPGFGPWEESSLTLVRAGERLDLADIDRSGYVCMRPVVVSYSEFASRLASVAIPFASLLRDCRRFATEHLAADDEKRKTIIENVLDEETLEAVDMVAMRSVTRST
jgi:hypothetical protein